MYSKLLMKNEGLEGKKLKSKVQGHNAKHKNTHNWKSMWKIDPVCFNFTAVQREFLDEYFPELVMSTDLLSFGHPSVLLFCFVPFNPVVSAVQWKQLFSDLL